MGWRKMTNRRTDQGKKAKLKYMLYLRLVCLKEKTLSMSHSNRVMKEF